MPTTTRSERWRYVRALQALLVAGRSDGEALSAFEQQRVDAGLPPIPRRTLRRYLSLAHADWQRGASGKHRHWRSRAIAARLRAQRLAVEGRETPDLSAYLKAQDGLDELLVIGGDALDEARALGEVLARELLAVLAAEVDDDDLRRRVVRGLRVRFERLELGLPPEEAQSGPSLLPDGFGARLLPPPNGATNGFH